MKNFSLDKIKEITAAVQPKKEKQRLNKAEKEYKEIQETIFSAAKRGNYSIEVNFFPLEPEVFKWLKDDGFSIENKYFSFYTISWN